jgi:hypothetical protein
MNPKDYLKKVNIPASVVDSVSGAKENLGKTRRDQDNHELTDSEPAPELSDLNFESRYLIQKHNGDKFIGELHVIMHGRPGIVGIELKIGAEFETIQIAQVARISKIIFDGTAE